MTPIVEDKAGYRSALGATLTVPAELGLLTRGGVVYTKYLEASLVAGPSSGTVKVNTDGSFTYTPAGPAPGGLDSFKFQVVTKDKTVTSAVKTATISTGGWHGLGWLCGDWWGLAPCLGS